MLAKQARNRTQITSEDDTIMHCKIHALDRKQGLPENGIRIQQNTSLRARDRIQKALM